MQEATTLRCGKYNFSLHGDPSSVASVAAGFSDLRSRTDESTVRWRFADNGGEVLLTIAKTPVAANVPRHLLPAVAVSTLTRHVIDHEPDRLHLHAAAVIDDGAALVIAGPSGSGKSTLCTALVSTGSAYVSDEMIAVDPQTHRLHSFPKPISVKKYAISTVEQITGLTAPTERNAPWMVVASQLGTLAANDDHICRTIVLYRHDRNSPTTIEPVHRATVARELLADSQDAERMGPDALTTVARLVARSRTIRATGADAADIADSLRQIHRVEQPAGSLLELQPSRRTRSGPGRSTHVRSVLLDGRALLYDKDRSQVIELDAETSTWWAMLDGGHLQTLVNEYANHLGTTPSESDASAEAALKSLHELGVLTH